MGMKFGLTPREEHAEGALKQDDEGNTWILETGSKRRMKKIKYWGASFHFITDQVECDWRCM